ncbi:ankyrin repeat and protein kinase domain-containing protein 1-like [Strongylocentrotus purpuratus]|uniref:Protein kinase domain-containing protein n=1 Tax=Strongylocentrotus purpuratus TaxID=7668 RepID=A0A7M7P7A2_STRPU|nr:ankyrin repeat and protein kinase domain-containing protein 1-like [Strongylocentrotus purpuratus]
MMHLTVEDSSGKTCAFHEKKAREHEGCHLGGGSFGEVFKATHKVHGEVAVKLAKPGKEDLVEMYQKEVRKHGISLTSDHIVAIKGFVQCEVHRGKCGLFGIVMKYMENGSLWDFRKRRWQDHPDLWPLTNRMVYEISCGMHFLHSNDIIHRDLKLENVLVDGNLHAKIADLGLAADLRTSFGDRCWGTDSHKPPEAFRTDLSKSIKVVNPKYDVYSFAMTLYELLTGIHPYAERGLEMVKVFKLSDQAPCLKPVPVNTPTPLIKVMTDSWRYAANSRPAFIEITDWVKNQLNIKPTHRSLGICLGEVSLFVIVALVFILYCM